ncbi:hypothetical protein [uncultured Lacinutrix sp.]|uniref:hypothetical protein n=1 Tax=uncultured Lacinutrix sp. TaxID=574032 RepID=UPI002615E760|nr:hypothetical protein [uncultured Lacinutrix sp.]
MLSEERLNYFLKTSYKDIKEQEYNDLVNNYFRVKKDDWYQIKYSIHRNGEYKDWGYSYSIPPSKITVFWQLIRLHCIPNSINNEAFDFSSFIFPTSQGTGDFWDENDKKEFKFKTTFLDAIFLDEIDFLDTIFLKEVNFTNTTFSSQAKFNNSIFFGKTYFLRTKFISHISFEYVKFSAEQETVFEDCSGSDSLSNKVIFNFNFSKLNENVLFRRIHFHYTSFFQATVKNTVFEECYWKGNNRIIFHGTIPKGMSLFNFYSSTEERYRQIKVAYKKLEDWEKSGKAYVSEMYIKQWRILFQIFGPTGAELIFPNTWYRVLAFPFIKTIEFLIHAFYGLFSGYTQSITKPIVWYSLFSFFIFPFIYSDCSISSFFSCNVQENWRSSIFNSLPFFKINVSIINEDFWVLIFQKILSTILITFFILALRKRFKQ